MARTGRPPKPVEQKKLEGTLRARDAQTPVTVGGRTRPMPSMLLTEGQVERFEAIVDELESADILDAADRGMIELAAIEEANVILCNAILSGVVRTESDTEDGENPGTATSALIIQGAMGGAVINPAANARAKSLTHLRQLYAELGIGPASRARFRNAGIKGAEPEKSIPAVAKFSEARARLRVVGDE